MGKKIRFPDYALKIISLFIAVGLWLYVSYEESPKSEYWFENIPVTYINDNLENYYIKRVTDTEAKTVSVKVRGTRSAILGLTSEDIIATVDLSSVKRTGEHNLSYSISFPIDGFEVIDKQPYLITAKVEKLVTKSFELKLSAYGNPAEGCEPGEITSSVSKVDISGPEELVERVTGCSAAINIENKKTVKNTPAEIKVILNDNTYYGGNDLSLSNTHTIASVNIICEKELAVAAKVENRGLAEISGISVSPESVTVKGPVSVLETVETIETQTIYINEINKEQDAALILPEGVQTKDGIQTVRIKVDFKE